MRACVRGAFLFLFSFSCAVPLSLPAAAQAGAGSGTISGTVSDPTGAVLPGARVTIENPVSQFERTTKTDSSGGFRFTNVPYNSYHMTVSMTGFSSLAKDVNVQSATPVTVPVTMSLGAATTTVQVTSQDLVNNAANMDTDIDRKSFAQIPLESQSSGLSSLVTLSTPGVTADSNGMFHGLGDHAENSFSVDGQPITDQQSKAFSNQLPDTAVQSMQVIEGAPPAEYGDKTSLVIQVTTRSGQGVTTPHGSVWASYGTFGTTTGGFDLSYGGKNWGNFISANALNSGRFLDPPEFAVMHDKGNEENLFDRVDYQLTSADSIHLNFGFTRSWFQTPNTFDSQFATPWNGVVVSNGGLDPNGNVVGPADQRSQIKTFNIAPSWTRLLSGTAVFTLGAFVRRDQFNYYPSADPFADLGPTNLQRETVGQNRTLTNAGLRSDISYVKGIHNLKVGAVYQQTFLDETDPLGIVDPTLNAPCLDANGTPVWVGNPGVNDPGNCPTATSSNPLLYPTPFVANLNFNPLLGCYDLTRPTPSPSDNCPSAASGLYTFNGHTDVKELALYVQDSITKGNWALNVGLRGDFYNGLTRRQEAQPRLGVAYNIKRTSTVLRVSYARTMETPFNENLVLSNNGCANPVLNPLLGCTVSGITPFVPGWRNEFHAGLQQAFGKYVVFSGEYIWKYTHNAYDFSVLGNTPITFPIEWDRSKIPGFAGRVSVPNYHGFSALAVFSSVAARFFTPQI